MFRSKRGESGDNHGSWAESTETYLLNHKGTPGAEERKKNIGVTQSDDPPLTPFIISEFSTADDWIELQNVSSEKKSLENYQLSQVTALDTETRLVDFKGKKFEVEPGEVFLVISGTTNSDIPEGSPLADGVNLGKEAAQREKKGSSVQYWISGSFTIDAGPSLLVLRNDRKDDSSLLKTAKNIIDITGGGSFSSNDGTTSFWPLTKSGGAHGETVKTSGQDPEKDKSFDNDRVYKRNKTDKYRDAETWVSVGWTGIGYKRNATPGNDNGGTPGYDNNAQKSDGAEAQAAVEISEIMYAVGDRGLTQWVELRNTSKVHGVNVGSWRLNIVNHHETMDEDGMIADWAGAYSDKVDLKGTIPPGQSYLIVARETGRDTTNLPEDRIEPAKKKRSELLVNPYGFQLKLVAKRDDGDQEVDIAGNLNPKPEGARRADAQSFNDMVAWNWPVAISEGGDRISVVRVGDDGKKKGSWALYNTTDQYADILDDTYYGHESDISSPGHHFGGVLPVSLSKFRPERLKDTGQVVIRWVTESELNNAGFNILRSETRDGEFTKINTKLIAGQGTTSERHVYEYADTSAKPNVVYYYQIQDVSLDGQVSNSRTTHLRGNVTAAGKATTTWGEIKALQ